MLSFFSNIVGTFSKPPYVLFFPQLWKSFSTVVVNFYHSCEKPFPQLWKE